jgi:hypothetical protein
MAEYINIKGQNIEVVASDPANPTVGQIWYNSTSNTLKGGGVTTAGAWSSGTSLPTARAENGGVGSKDAFLFVGGNPGGTTESLSYDGTTWTATNSLTTGKGDTGAAGSTTSAINAGGGSPPLNAAEEWDGTSWSAITATPAFFYGATTAGNSAPTSLFFGGATPSAVNNTRLWNGTAWSELATLATARNYAGGFGTSTAAIISGGQIGPGAYNSATESWNGTIWTSSTSYPQPLFQRSTGAGIQTAGIMYGGQHTPGVNTYMTLTNFFDGSTWTATGSLLAATTGAAYSTTSNTQNIALAAGGSQTPGATTAVYEFTGPGAPTTKTITAS